LKAKRPIATLVFFTLTLLLVVLDPNIPHMRLPYTNNPVTVIQTPPSTERPVYGPPQNTSSPQSPLVAALIWLVVLGVTATIVGLYVRFNAKHNEHPEYDDHPPPETWVRGLHTYMRIMGRERDELEQESKDSV